MREVLPVAIALALSLSAVGCEVYLPTAKGPTVSLRMAGTPADASVTVDDEYVGPLAVVVARGVALPVGTHRISVESPGYFPWDALVEAKDKLVRLEVHLTPIPD